MEHDVDIIYDVKHSSEFSLPRELSKHEPAYWLVRYIKVGGAGTHPEPIAVFNWDREGIIFQKFLDNWKGRVGKVND